LPRLITKLLVLFAAVQLLGGHWAVMQTVAWTGMLIENARTESLGEALVKTFDGSKPCPLCLAVKAGRESEEKQDVAKLLVKIEAILASQVALPARAEVARRFFIVGLADREVSVAPITPPPKVG
jgi:hypothetical protein